jgi:hypothetical protein
MGVFRQLFVEAPIPKKEGETSFKDELVNRTDVALEAAFEESRQSVERQLRDSADKGYSVVIFDDNQFNEKHAEWLTALGFSAQRVKNGYGKEQWKVAWK